MTEHDRETRYQRQARLDELYAQGQSIILSRQDPITGLLPASTAVTIHGDYTDAWVRDNVYSILAVWGLALAFRRENQGGARAYELEHSVVKLMRGLLTSMMKQRHKVETFKHSLQLLDALHAKYDTRTGDPVVGDDEWGHLQLDATSLFLLMIAQMTASGLRIIYNQEEVDFIQNLVHYISRTYITPDFGLWERGGKMNIGNAEINTSSVGMAKAALEALSGFDLYGGEGGEASVIHVVEDDIANARNTLETLLPRESRSKEIDAAQLSIIGFPAFAVENAELMTRTREEIVAKLQGRFGCKRFLRDGHQTVVEDHDRLHYEEGELKAFEHIESEWPLFFTYLLLDGLMRDDQPQIEFYRKALAPLFVERDGQRLLPELYYVEADKVDAERARPHSQPRAANDNLPLVWAQSLYMLGELLMEGYIFPSDIDPLDRRWRHHYRRDTRVHLAIVAENSQVEAILDDYGILSQTPAQIAPVRIAAPADLAKAYARVGQNEKLGLSGRPQSHLDTLATSQLFTLRNEKVIFLPHFLATRHSYFQLDNRFLVEQIKGELAYVQRHWRQPGRPLLTLVITRSMLSAPEHELLVALLKEMQTGRCDNVEVRVKRVAEHIPGVTQIGIDYLHDFQLQDMDLAASRTTAYTLGFDATEARRLTPKQNSAWRTLYDNERLLAKLHKSKNPYEHIEIVSILWERQSGEESVAPKTDLRKLIEEIYSRAAEERLWGVMRRAAALLGWYDEHLEVEVANLVMRGLRVAVGRSFAKEVLIEKPLNNSEITALINTYGGDNPLSRLLIQEIVLLLGKLIKVDPQAFRDTYTLQCWHLLLLLTGELAWKEGITQDAAFDDLLELSPQAIMEHLLHLLTSSKRIVGHLASIESLKITINDGLSTIQYTEEYNPELDGAESGWLGWRKLKGAVTRLPEQLRVDIWDGLGHCAGIVIGDRLDSHNRLDSKIVRADMTASEPNFALLIEDMLNHIQATEYRQLVIEALRVLSKIFRANPTLQLNDYVVLDVLIGHAVRLHWLNTHSSQSDESYRGHSADAWAAFYDSAPHEVANAITSAFVYLVEEFQKPATETDATGDKEAVQPG